MVEKRSLTEEDIARAENRADSTHPIVSVIDQNLPKIETLKIELGHLPSDQQRPFFAANFGFLADAMTEAGPFTLEPLDMIAIWSKVVEVFPVSTIYRYPVAAAVSSAYAVQGIDNPNWKKFPAKYLNSRRIPEELKQDRNGLEHVREKLEEVGTSLSILAPYRRSSIIDKLSENFGNGFTSLRINVHEALLDL